MAQRIAMPFCFFFAVQLLGYRQVDRLPDKALRNLYFLSAVLAEFIRRIFSYWENRKPLCASS